MKAEEAYALSRKYTENTVAGAGAVAGKPCQIQSITDITGGHRITFLWKDNSNVDHTSVMDVMDGKGIKAVAVNSSNHLIITYDDDTIVDAGEIDIHSAVNSVNGKTGNVDLTASDVGALPNNTSIPSKTSDLTNDSIVDSASYDSTNHQILFKNGTTTLFSLDAAAFVKDGMVDDVEISSGNLVITFNTDAGKQAISIPLTDIFNPANYYDKDDVDGLLADKADKTDVDSDIAGQQSLLKDTVGWTGKNLIVNGGARTSVINGVTFVVNQDGSVTCNGTATGNYANFIMLSCGDNVVILKSGKYILSGCPSNGGQGKYQLVAQATRNGALYSYGEDWGDGLTITAEDGDSLQIVVNVMGGQTVDNITFYPMLRKADIMDDTYEPYHIPGVVSQEAQNVLGAKNLLPYPYVDYTKTVDSVTFTDNGDGSVSLNGTALANPEFRITPDIADNRYKGMILTSQGGSSTASGAYVRLRVGDKSSGSFIREVAGSKIVIPEMASNEKYYIAIRVTQGTDTSGIRIYPMLRLASDPDDTYQPYAMTNRELTEKVFEKRTLTSADDLNNIRETGIYGITSAPTNSPENTDYASLIVQKTGSTEIRQIIFKQRSAGGNIYVRASYTQGSHIAWTAWNKFTGTVVS